MSVPVLRIDNLHLSFRGWAGTTDVLHGISLDVGRAERVALVGESGSGKSVTARIIVGLLQMLKSARISGAVEFEGEDIARMTSKQAADLRGRRISMIFQDPTSSLNPVYRIGSQFHDVLRRGDRKIASEAASAKAAELLDEVAIPDGRRVLDSYSFQLSGGMNQRVMIAMALANEPSLLIADEPGTALDVTVQAKTLNLMRQVVSAHGTAVLFISHNLGVVREFADRVYVIYRGRIVEHGPAETVFAAPGHPYTRALMAAVPKLTGGGIPDAISEEGDFLRPMVDHFGAEGAQ